MWSPYYSAYSPRPHGNTDEIQYFVHNTDQIPAGLRLVNSTHVSTTSGGGRLEIYLNDRWGTVCDDGFGAADAKLACNQLGFSKYIRYGRVRSLG